VTEHLTKGSTISRDLRVNQMIRIPQVRVVDEEGAQLGVMPTPQALAMAQERGLDLVEVAPMASPPVVKFLDFGQYKYELTKREKEAKRKQRSVTFKEVRLKPKIGTGDFDTKVRRAIQFLEEGDRIKVAVQFRGRELTHPEIGRALLARFSEQIKDHGVVERAPLLEGKSMHITVASVHKPKVVEHPTKHGHATEEPASDEAPAAVAAPAVKAPPAAAEVQAAAEAPAAAPAPAVDAPAAAPAPAPAAPAVEAPAPKPTAKPVAAKATAVAVEPAAEPKPAAKTTRTTTRTRKTSEPEAPAPAPAGE
jgi:translation initiation factor IF-3